MMHGQTQIKFIVLDLDFVKADGLMPSVTLRNVDWSIITDCEVSW